MAEKTVTYAVKVPVETNAVDAAESVEDLQKALAAAKSRIQQYGQAYKNLKGDSDAVTEAKKRLSAMALAEQAGVTKATLKLVEQGASLTKLKGKTLEASEATKGFGLANLSLAGIATATAAALAAVTAALGAGALALGKWIVMSGNALRTQGLFQEAALGSADNALHMAHQIEALAGAVPQSREELQKLSLEMNRSLAFTRVSGQGIVDTFNAVAQASAAMGDTAGKKIEGIVERSKTWGRMGLGLYELQGTGINFQDVAGQLAKDLKIGIGAAQQQLALGRVNVNDGAKALREVVESKFGNINLRRMLDINVMVTKFKDTLSGLTRDVHLEPLLQVVQRFFKLFGEGSVTGQGLKTLITDFGNASIKAFTTAAPFVEKFFKAMVVAGLHAELAFLNVAVAIKKAFGVNIAKDFDDSTSAADRFGKALTGVAGLIDKVGDAIVYVVESLKTAVSWFEKAQKNAQSFGDTWKGAGTQMGGGMTDAFKKIDMMGLSNAGAKMAENMDKAFSRKAEIHSPSALMERRGRQLGEGLERGASRKAGDVGAMMGGKLGAGGLGPIRLPAGSGGVRDINVTVHVGAGAVTSAAATLTSPSFKAQLVQAFREMLIGAGLNPDSTRGDN